MTHDAFGRIDWLKRALGDVPPLIVHMREQTVPSMQAAGEPRVSGSKERTIAPLNLTPLDDADELWSVVCSLAVDYAERSGSWRELPDALDRQWRIATSAEITVRGFATSNPDRIYSDVVAVIRYLREHAFTIAIERAYTDPVDKLVEHIEGTRRRYSDAPAFAPHKHRCPRCLFNAVVPTYSASGEIKSLRCERCGSERRFDE